MEYDEDIRENRFFRELEEKYESVIACAIRKGSIVCVPRHGSFDKADVDEKDVRNHILLPSSDLPSTCFRTLNGKEITLTNKLLTVRDGATELSTSQLLFEEIFYERDFSKYRVWCIDRPLEVVPNGFSPYNRLACVSSLQEAMSFLWTEIHERELFGELTTAIESFESTLPDFESKPIESQRTSLDGLYAMCRRILLKDPQLRHFIQSSEHFARNCNLSLETYLLHRLRGIISRSVSARTAEADAELNKVLRNVTHREISDFEIRVDLHERIHLAKLKLSQLNRFSTVLGKTECLKRAVHTLSDGLQALSSDDLLPALVFLVVKAGLPNWIAQVIFMKHFRLTVESVHETDETSFLITSLEAAIQHAKTAALKETDTFEKEIFGSSLGPFFLAVRDTDVHQLKEILQHETHNLDSSREPTTLCHPLCTCENCKTNRELRDRLPTRIHVNSKDENGLTALHIAASYDRRENVLEFLLDQGADPNTLDNQACTPLHRSCSYGHTDATIMLLRGNADPAITDSQGNSALHLAAEHGHIGCVEAMLRFSKQPKTEPSPVNFEGDTPLHRASKWGYLEIVQTLLIYGANPTSRNKKGQTPLSLAHSKMVSDLFTNAALSASPSSLLLSTNTTSTATVVSSFNSSANICDQVSRISSLDYERVNRTMDKLFAAINDRDTCLACYYLGLQNHRRKMENRTSDMCHPLCDCIRCMPNEEFAESRRTVGGRGIAINARNRTGETALHVACAVGSTEIVRILLDAGANVNARTELEQRTPLHLACLSDNISVLEFLVNSASCDLDAKDRNGDTPLHLAVKVADPKLVRLLVRHGASTDVRNHRGITPLRQLHEEISKEASSSISFVDISNILKRNAFENTRPCL